VQEIEAAMADDELPQRKSARSVRRRNFADLEEPTPEDDDSWEVGDDSESERIGVPGAGRKRRRPSAAAGAGPAEDRRFGKNTESLLSLRGCLLFSQPCTKAAV
jgi:hypothetical protein